jgi:hypothetical protein
LAQSSATSSRRTVVRSIRLERSLEDSITKFALLRDITPNSLIASALTKYVDWDESSERFRYVTLPEGMLRAIVNSLPKRDAKELGKSLGPRMVKETLQFRFKRVTMNSFIEYIKLISKYSGIARCELDLDQGAWTLIYRHQLGEKWSAFISAFYGEALAKLFSAQVQSDPSESQVVIRWTGAAVAKQPPQKAP